MDGLHPDCVLPSLTVIEYTAFEIGVAAVVAEEAPSRLVPLQLNTVAPPEGLASSVTVPPSQMWPLFVGDATGVLCTETEVVYTVAGAQPEPVVPLVTISE